MGLLQIRYFFFRFLFYPFVLTNTIIPLSKPQKSGGRYSAVITLGLYLLYWHPYLVENTATDCNVSAKINRHFLDIIEDLYANDFAITEFAHTQFNTFLQKGYYGSLCKMQGGCIAS